MLPSLLLLSMVAMATAGSARRPVGVFCPEVTADIICDGPVSGFVYSDGCREVACDAAGSVKPDAAAETVACRSPETFREREACQRHAVEVFKQVIVYRERQESRVRQEQQNAAEEAEEAASVAGVAEESVNADEGPFECPALAPNRVCRHRPGFSYSDGCNRLRCVSSTRALGSRASCPVAGDAAVDAAAAARYCRHAERQMRAKAAKSAYRYECLLPQQVCKSEDNVGTRYHDGCNVCVCSGVETAYCHRLPCHPVFSTAEEFKDVCQRRGAGPLD